MNRPEIETLSSAEVYRNRWMTAREDRVRRADGSGGIYGVVSKPDFAVILPWDGAGLTLVEQYRYPLGRRRFPADEVRRMVLRGGITDATTVAAPGLWELRSRA